MPLREDDQALDLLRFLIDGELVQAPAVGGAMRRRVGSGRVRRLPAASACTW